MISRSGAAQVDLLYGHATAESGKLTLPIPDGYFFYVWMTDIGDKTSNTEIARRAKDPVGTLCDKTNTVNRDYNGPTSTDSYISRLGDYLTIRGNNGNTTGTFISGVDYTYSAWKETRA